MSTLRASDGAVSNNKNKESVDLVWHLFNTFRQIKKGIEKGKTKIHNMKIVMGFPNASQQEYDIIIGHFNLIKKGILNKNNGGGISKFGTRIERELEKTIK
uniref:Uncharacterized protein n=1 Tax=Meloidogyne enterolobii TaxID=390850 RepID=A0A6V7UJB1_MELEN|nr:unnamed protein product [Meloidogyne enterolobii]